MVCIKSGEIVTGILLPNSFTLVPSGWVLILFTRMEGVLLCMETIILSTQLPVLEEVEATANTQFLTSLTNDCPLYQTDIYTVSTQALLLEIFTYQMEEQALFGCMDAYSSN